MDDDLELGILSLFGLLSVFLLLPFLTILAATLCVAHSRTKKWQKEKFRRTDPASSTLEMDPLVEEEDYDSDDFLDTDDEADSKAKKEEERLDFDLTTRQKFRKEVRRIWSGKNAARVAREKEREERVKMAKAVAREIRRFERRRAKKVGRGEGSSSLEGPPSYGNAVAGGEVKQ